MQLDEEFLANDARRSRADWSRFLPGSRTQEVEHNLKWFLKAAALVQDAIPKVRFAVAAFKPHQAQMAEQLIAGNRLAGRSLCSQNAGADSSGRLLHGLLRLGLAGAFVSQKTDGRSLLDQSVRIPRAKFLPSREIHHAGEFADGQRIVPRRHHPVQPDDPASSACLFPEYLTYEDKSLQIASHVIQWLANDEHREGLVAD